LSVVLLVCLMFAVAWFAPTIDVDGERAFDAQVFWVAVLIGLAASAVLPAVRAARRRSRGR
jgi:hypothetical protein